MVVLLPTVLPPVTIPLSEPTVAAAGLLLVHSPPGTTSDSAAVAPAHTVEGPETGSGEVLTVTVMEVVQPVGNV